MRSGSPSSRDAMAEKIDFKKTIDGYRARQGEFRVVDLPELQYLMIDGHGDPNTSSDYAHALAALYPVAYKLKFASARGLGRDYVVGPLEGLWWADDMASFLSRNKSQWRWTMMILTPDWLGQEEVDDAVAQAGAKDAPSWLGQVRLETLSEGRCVQTLHVGSFDDEGPVLARMHDEFIPANGLHMTGRHHEIYLSDPRRTAPEKLRTILRQPVGS
ncbi:GyrI-like domain-containing protein [Tessaracoccus sp.]|uniref:GyrI-like domain-containing protein n=1 Tax=Tessaracoccus sp. TaxID=1971211 RepID=UPI0026313DFD|nr:GyrI-like domain-containing protein [Tessaracoccus sp.]